MLRKGAGFSKAQRDERVTAAMFARLYKPNDVVAAVVDRRHYMPLCIDGDS